MISFAPDGDVNNFGGNIVATASTDIHGGVKGTNGIHGAHDEYPKSPSNAPPPKAMGPSYRRSNLESPVLLYSCRILALRLFNYIMVSSFPDKNGDDLLTKKGRSAKLVAWSRG